MSTCFKTRLRATQQSGRSRASTQTVSSTRSSTHGDRLNSEGHKGAQRQRRTVKERSRNQPKPRCGKAGCDRRQREGEIRLHEIGGEQASPFVARRERQEHAQRSPVGCAEA